MEEKKSENRGEWLFGGRGKRGIGKVPDLERWARTLRKPNNQRHRSARIPLDGNDALSIGSSFFLPQILIPSPPSTFSHFPNLYLILHPLNQHPSLHSHIFVPTRKPIYLAVPIDIIDPSIDAHLHICQAPSLTRSPCDPLSDVYKTLSCSTRSRNRCNLSIPVSVSFHISPDAVGSPLCSIANDADTKPYRIARWRHKKKSGKSLQFLERQRTSWVQIEESTFADVVLQLEATTESSKESITACRVDYDSST